jgi:hypothetical protein
MKEYKSRYVVQIVSRNSTIRIGYPGGPRGQLYQCVELMKSIAKGDDPIVVVNPNNIDYAEIIDLEEGDCEK